VGGHVLDVLPQLPDLVHAVVGGAVDFVNIYRIPGRNLAAGAAIVAGAAVPSARQFSALARMRATVVLPVPRVRRTGWRAPPGRP